MKVATAGVIRKDEGGEEEREEEVETHIGWFVSRVVSRSVADLPRQNGSRPVGRSEKGVSSRRKSKL
jgi:hypothetical protein